MDRGLCASQWRIGCGHGHSVGAPTWSPHRHAMCRFLARGLNHRPGQQKLLGSTPFRKLTSPGITMPITKHNVVVARAEDIARTS